MTHVAVVLAAGQGTRMRSPLPKVLHTVAGRPMLAWVLDAVADTKPERTVVVLGHGAEQVAATLPEGVEWCLQAEQLGTGHAARTALEHLGEQAGATTVMVVPGDTPFLTGEALGDLLAAHGRSGAALTVLTSVVSDPSGYGRVVRAPTGEVTGVVEQRDADEATLRIAEVNAGMYVAAADGLSRHLEAVRPDNAQGEYYLTDVVGLVAGRGGGVEAVPVDEAVVVGINNHAQLAAANATRRRMILERSMAEGVVVVDPERTYVDHGVELAAGVTLYPGVHLQGPTVIETGAVVGPDVFCLSSRIGEGARVWYSVVRDAVVGPGCEVGPFASLRQGTVLEAGSKAGTFVEMKQTVVGEGAKVPHLSYLGDATVGERANVGAGTITCNYDGRDKHPTHIGADAFIGSDTMLVAPVTIGDRAMTGAGSVITADVEPDALAVARSRQRNIPGYASRRRERYRAERAEDAGEETKEP